MKRLTSLACMALFGMMLLQMGCKNNAVTVSEPDPQVEKCIDTDKIDPDARCMKNYKPVCGCDGKTYSNSCMADKAGVVTYTEGKCKE